MMKRYYIIILSLICATFSIYAQNLTEKAAKAYSADKYDEAISLYHQIIEKEGVSSDLYYNLGNAYYKSGQLGKAILYYERALILNPGNDDAQNNLEFVNSKIVDKYVSSENIVSSFADKILALTSSNGWGIIAIVSFLMLIFAIALYVFTDNIFLRKCGFFGGIAFIIICVTANIISIKAASNLKDSHSAIVMKNVVILSTSPREPKNKAEEAFLLHEGTKLRIMDSVNVNVDSTAIEWYDVIADDTHRAWIKKSDVEKI